MLTIIEKTGMGYEVRIIEKFSVFATVATPGEASRIQSLLVSGTAAKPKGKTGRKPTGTTTVASAALLKKDGTPRGRPGRKPKDTATNGALVPQVPAMDTTTVLAGPPVDENKLRTLVSAGS